MKKYIWLSAAYLVVVGIFNMLCFVFINDHTTGFYISIGFGNGSIIICAIATLISGRRNKFEYLNIQNVYISSSYFIISTLLNLIFILSEMQNVTANWMTNVLLLSIYLVTLFIILSAKSASIEQINHDRNENIALLNLHDRIKALINKGASRSVNKKIESLYDAISSAQIERTTDVSIIDSQIINMINVLHEAIVNNESDDKIVQIIYDIMELIQNRNIEIEKNLRRG